MARSTGMRRDYVAEIIHGLYDSAGSDQDEPFLTTAMARRLNGHEALKRHLAQDGIAGETLDHSIRTRWFNHPGRRRGQAT